MPTQPPIPIQPPLPTQTPLPQPPLPLLTNTGKYIRLGGSVYDWWLAHVKRFMGWDWFPKDNELFWVVRCFD